MVSKRHPRRGQILKHAVWPPSVARAAARSTPSGQSSRRRVSGWLPAVAPAALRFAASACARSFASLRRAGWQRRGPRPLGCAFGRSRRPRHRRSVEAVAPHGWVRSGRPCASSACCRPPAVAPPVRSSTPCGPPASRGFARSAAVAALPALGAAHALRRCAAPLPPRVSCRSSRSHILAIVVSVAAPGSAPLARCRWHPGRNPSRPLRAAARWPAASLDRTRPGRRSAIIAAMDCRASPRAPSTSTRATAQEPKRAAHAARLTLESQRCPLFLGHPANRAFINEKRRKSGCPGTKGL